MTNTKNVVAIQIPKEKLSEMQTHITALQTLLSDYVVALTSEQRRALPKMNDKTMPFVEKGLEYSKSNPEFVPVYLDVREFDTDMAAVTDLKSLFNPISQVCKNLDNSILLSGSEAYQAALTYYNNVKQAAKMNVPNAKPIADDLGKRFVKASKKEEPLP
jgi:hypothetical protein